MEGVRWEDYEIDYANENSFSFLGNGFELRESDGRDITNYLGYLEDGKDVQPVWDEELIDVLGGVTLGEEYLVRGA
jgi:hypothetical protein